MTIFEVANGPTHMQTGVLYSLATMGMILVILSIIRLLRAQRYVTKASCVIGIVMGACSLVATISALSTQKTRLPPKIESHPKKVVEGLIEKFQGMPYAGHGADSFSVSGINFQISDYVETGGYNVTVSHGGVLRPGARARLTYVEIPSVGRIITKVEISTAADP